MRPVIPCLLLTSILLATCASMRPSAHATLANVQQYAGAPIRRFDDRNSYQGWQVIDPRNLVLFVGDDAYLLTVAPPCVQMQFATNIRLADATPAEVSRLDYVLFDQERCLIDQIRPLQADKVRQVLAQQGSAAHRG
ncbi:MAG: DUF6491 family protein [Steroidobacteraceae bacterium]